MTTQDIRRAGEFQTDPGRRDTHDGAGTGALLRGAPGGAARKLGIALGLALLVAAPYAQVAGHRFLVLDDPAYVTRNPRVLAGVTGEGVAWAFTSVHAFNWHPLTWLSHMLDVTLFGLRPGPHHLVNVLFHLANVLLLYGILRRATGNAARSAFVAALFAVHPMHAESVAWIAERKDVMAAFFGLSAVLAYVRYAEKPSGGRILPVAALLLLSLLSKQSFVTLPALLLVLDFWPLGRAGGGTPLRRRVREKLPLLALSAAGAAAALYAQGSGGSIASLDAHPLPARAANVLVSLASYLGKAAWPASLSVFYPLTSVTLPAAKVVGAAVLLAGITTVSLRGARAFPWLPAGWFWFLLSMAPVAGLIQLGEQAMANRYAYIPYIGLYWIVAWGGAELADRARVPGRARVGAAAVAVVLLAVAAHGEVGSFRDSRTLFGRALERDPENWLAHNSLGVALQAEGRAAEARERFLRAVRIRPGYWIGWYNLGVASEQLGRADEAIAHYREAIRRRPAYAEAHTNLGAALHRKGDREGAIRHYREAIRIDPSDPVAARNLEMLRGRGAPPG